MKKAKVSSVVSPEERRYYAARAEECLNQASHAMGEARRLMELAGFPCESWNRLQPGLDAFYEVVADVRRAGRDMARKARKARGAE